MKSISKYIDFKLFSILAIAYGVIEIINFLKLAYFKYHDLSFREISWSKIIFDVAIRDYITIMIFMLFVIMTTKKMLENKTKLWIIVVTHGFFSFFLGAFGPIINILYEVSTGLTSWSDISFDTYVLRYISVIDVNFLVYISLVTIIYIYYYFNRLKASEVEESELRAQLSQTKLKFLQTQIHPHFLFNTLNSIHSLMDINKERSKDMIVDLGDILREVLNQKDKNLIELQEELEILNKYLNIKKTRFSDQLNITIDVEDDLENVLVPNMLIQPIIENSVKHGYDANNNFLNVNLKIAKADDRLLITIENDGKSLNEKISKLLKKGTGLQNIKDRLFTLYGEDYSFKMFNKNVGVLTSISFPMQVSISEIPDEKIVFKKSTIQEISPNSKQKA